MPNGAESASERRTVIDCRVATLALLDAVWICERPRRCMCIEQFCVQCVDARECQNYLHRLRLGFFSRASNRALISLPLNLSNCSRPLRTCNTCSRPRSTKRTQLFNGRMNETKASALLALDAMLNTRIWLPGGVKRETCFFLRSEIDGEAIGINESACPKKTRRVATVTGALASKQFARKIPTCLCCTRALFPFSLSCFRRFAVADIELREYNATLTSFLRRMPC